MIKKSISQNFSKLKIIFSENDGKHQKKSVKLIHLISRLFWLARDLFRKNSSPYHTVKKRTVDWNLNLNMNL